MEWATRGGNFDALAPPSQRKRRRVQVFCEKLSRSRMLVCLPMLGFDEPRPARWLERVWVYANSAHSLGVLCHCSPRPSQPPLRGPLLPIPSSPPLSPFLRSWERPSSTIRVVLLPRLPAPSPPPPTSFPFRHAPRLSFSPRTPGNSRHRTRHREPCSRAQASTDLRQHDGAHELQVERDLCADF